MLDRRWAARCSAASRRCPPRISRRRPASRASSVGAGTSTGIGLHGLLRIGPAPAFTAGSRPVASTRLRSALLVSLWRRAPLTGAASTTGTGSTRARWRPAATRRTRLGLRRRRHVRHRLGSEPASALPPSPGSTPSRPLRLVLLVARASADSPCIGWLLLHRLGCSASARPFCGEPIVSPAGRGEAPRGRGSVPRSAARRSWSPEYSPHHWRQRSVASCSSRWFWLRWS